MNRRDFFRSMTAAMALPVLGRTSEGEPPAPLSEPTLPAVQSYRWEVGGDALMTSSARALTEEEIAASVQREIVRLLSDI